MKDANGTSLTNSPWYTNETGIKGQKNIDELLKVYRSGSTGAYDPFTNQGGTSGNYAGNIYYDELARQIKAMSGVEATRGDDEIRLGYQGLEEQRQRQGLGQEQQNQILGFADDQQKRASDYHTQLAQSLANQGQQFFNMQNPAILEDLNSRGLFTSQTARDKSQADALKEIELNNQSQLMNFDTNSFNQINDIRGSGLSALLAGNQSGLDAALESRKAGLQRSFDLADQQTQQSFAEMLAKRKSRDSMTSSLLGLGGQLGAAYLSGGTSLAPQVAQQAAPNFMPSYGLGQKPGYSFLPPSLSLY